ncbi:HAD family hydrolase [Candidatus Micrarchaeota archaeon]|nr:HAD family hydrolase [Candidatus Micrarchaeota archaeon]
MESQRVVQLPHAGPRRPLKDYIRHVFWAVDGTLYRKTSEIRNAQRLLLYNAFAICRTRPEIGHDPFAVGKNMLFTRIEDVPKEVRQEFDGLEANEATNPNGKYRSFGAMFAGEFGKDKYYVQRLVSTIDFGRLIARDERLIEMFSILMARYSGIPHNILTNGTMETAIRIFAALGLDLPRFENPKIDKLFPSDPKYVRAGSRMGILCVSNLKKQKPNPEAFEQMLEVAGLRDNPRKLLYVCDSEIKDSIPAGQLGITTCLVWTEKTQSTADFNLRAVYDLPELFEK